MAGFIERSTRLGPPPMSFGAPAIVALAGVPRPAVVAGSAVRVVVVVVVVAVVSVAVERRRRSAFAGAVRKARVATVTISADFSIGILPLLSVLPCVNGDSSGRQILFAVARHRA